MSHFKDVGRMVLEAQFTGLGLRDEVYDIPALVEDFVREYGFVDVGEAQAADPSALRALVARHETL